MIIKTDNGVRITTGNDYTYNLSDDAILRLREAQTADQAEIAFNGFAPHVARCHRVDVWFAVDNI